MATEELISKYIDRAAFESDTKFAIDQLGNLESEFKKLRDFRSNFQSLTGTKDITTNAAAAAATMKELTAAITAQNSTIKESAKVKAEQTKAEAENIKMQKELESLEQQRIKTKKLQTQADNEVIKQINLETDAELKALKVKEALEKTGTKTKKKNTAAEDFDPNSIPYTNNLADLEAENNSVSDGTEILNAYSRAQFEAAAAAAEFYGQSGKTASVTQAQVESLNEITLKYDKYSGTIASNIAVQMQNKKAIDDVKSQQQLLEAEISKSGSATDRQVEKLSILRSEELKLTEENKRLAVTIRAQAREAAAAEGAIDQLSSQLAVLQTTYASLTEAEKNQPFGQEIIKEIAILDPKVKAMEAELGKFQRNVGNYPKAVAAAMGALETEIDKINTKLKSTDKNSAQYSNLTRQLNLLKSVAGGLDKTFTSTKQELRALEEAAKKVGTEFGVTSEQFKNFSEQVGERKDELKDIQNAVNFKSSDTRGLDAALQGVQAITSAYGAYQSIIALTGSENEELAKSMQKLQAVTALVASIQGIVNALQSDSALIQGLMAAKSAYLTTVQKIVASTSGDIVVAERAKSAATNASATSTVKLAGAQVALVGTTGTLANSQSVATAKANGLAVANLAASGAIRSATLSANGLQTGLTGVGVAQTAVTRGAILLKSTLISTGIGLIIAGIAFAVQKLISALREQNAISASVKQATEGISDSMKELIDVTKEYNDILRLNSQEQLKYLDNILQKRKALGVSAEEGLALEKKFADERLRFTREEVARNNISNSSLNGLRTKYKTEQDLLVFLNEQKLDYQEKVKRSGDENYEKVIKQYDDMITHQKSVSEAAGAALGKDSEIFNSYLNALQQVDILQAQQQKLNADQRRKFFLESAKLEVDLATAKNNEILANDRSTLKERVNALDDNLKQQRKLINADLAAIKSDPTVSATDKKLAAIKAANELLKAESQSQIKIEEVREAFRLRDLQATAEVEKRKYDIISNISEAIYKNDVLKESQRLEALKTAVAARKAILDVGFETDLSSAGISDANIERIKKEGFFEIENKKITNEELKKLIAEYNASIIQLSRDTNIERIAIVKDYYQKEEELRNKALKAIERANDLELEDRTDTYNNQNIALNKAYSKGLIDLQTYNTRKLDLDNDFSKRSIRIAIDRVEKSLAATVSAAETEKRLKREIADLNSFTGPQTDDEKKVHADRLKVLTDELTKVQETIGKETELYKELSRLKKELSDADTKVFQTNQEKIVAGLEDLQAKAQQVFDVISGALNAVATSQKNRLQEQSDAIDKNSTAEIEAVNASLLSEQDKAAKIAIINARAQAQKEEIARRNRKIDEDNARAQKAFTIFQILLETALAIVKAHGNIAKIIFASAIGAAQLAIAIATPVPRFKTGKKDGYEGYGIVDDGGVNEPIYRAATGKIEVSSGRAKDRLTYLAKDDIVFTDHMDMMKHFAMPAVSPIMIKNSSNDFMIEELKDAITIQTPLLQQIANKRENHVSAKRGALVSIWMLGANQTKYFDENTNW